MSSRSLTSLRTSSRSIGVTNVEFSRWMDVVGDPVALLLADHDVAREVRPVGVVGEHLVEEVGAAHDVRGGLLEEVEEDAVLAGEDLGQAGHARARG